MAIESSSGQDHGMLPPPPGVELLWYGRVADTAADALGRRDVLDAEESARLDSFLRPIDRDAYAVAHVRLRQLLGERLGISPGAVRMARESCVRCGGPHGRPAVADGGVHFSLSHTRGLVLIGLAPTPVGVDVEGVPDTTTVDDVSGQLHPRERAELAALPAAERALAFARCWTRKEALLKGTGAGIGEELTTTYVGAGPQPAGDTGWLITDLPTLAGYAAAVAVRPGAGND
ncbi:4'-phosphopantetheinyl transferase family protein [Streptomyces sp. NPDC057638]|uniref:4'-phosphopantetheinyl transferase family protein n=1 Tax=Streptomyces sp. NPDC057638 TaxID=3346190 RepID=UPI0036A70990